jgi:hypothetical protein
MEEDEEYFGAPEHMSPILVLRDHDAGAKADAASNFNITDQAFRT